MKIGPQWIRWLIVAGVLAAVAAFFALGLQHEVSLEALKARQHALAGYRQSHPLALAALFGLVYVAATALSLPVATVMTLAAGAIFGLLEGTVLVSFAASIGATLAFLASRFVFGGAVQRTSGNACAASTKASSARARSISSPCAWFRCCRSSWSTC